MRFDNGTVTFRIDHNPLAQNRGTILMGIAVWRVTVKPKNESFLRHVGFRPEKMCDYQRSSEHVVTRRDFMAS